MSFLDVPIAVDSVWQHRIYPVYQYSIVSVTATHVHVQGLHPQDVGWKYQMGRHHWVTHYTPLVPVLF